MTKSPIYDSHHPRTFPPPWASSWGDDRYGLWAQFELQVERQSVQQRMRWIEPGEFVMGAAEGEIGRVKNEYPQHPVVISRGFWLADTTCTQALWRILQRNIPLHPERGDMLPVSSVGMNMVINFLQDLDALLPACYATLPTEAEWEYACRAGSSTAFSFGNVEADSYVRSVGLGKHYIDYQAPVEVKALLPNAWGLYHMHGNIWEWCADRMRKYDKQRMVDPGLEVAMARNTGKDYREFVVRGGSARYLTRFARSAVRFARSSGMGETDISFRFVLRETGNGAPQDFLSPQERAQTERRGDPFAARKE